MPTRRAFLIAATLVPVGSRAAIAAPKNPKYYFRIDEVKGDDDKIIPVARGVLEKELGGRPEFTSDITASDDAALVAELKQRKLQGFSVSLRLDRVKREVKPPKPGGRLKQLAVDVKLSVFGTTLPGEKLAFSGEGEAAIEGEVIERRMDEEAATLIGDVMARAMKQAVDQAVMKLSLPKSTPMNESRRKRKPQVKPPG